MNDPLANTLKRTREPEHPEEPGAAGTPGLVLIFTGGRANALIIPLVAGQLELGRDHPALVEAKDPRMSRSHAKILYDGRHFLAIDLGSSNGTAVDGAAIQAHRSQPIKRFVRIGDSLFLPVSNVAPFVAQGVRVEHGRVLGPTLQSVIAGAARAAQHGETLHITGETGAGKEGVARAFHAASTSSKGRFVAINCAAIPESIAERLLFGAKRGAYSGADADAEGYVQAADGGTLFLDEVGELNPAVQAKLLRVLEDKEVLPVGAARGRAVRLQICSASHQDLRAQVEAGRLRQDLYYRIAQPHVAVPPLRQRLEELPWLLQTVVEREAPTLSLHTSLVEVCLMRPWPGNIRELLGEARSAIHQAIAESAARIEGRHLSATAGAAFKAAESPPAKRTPVAPSSASGPDGAPDRAAIEAALQHTGGNISAAARLLKVHRPQLHRWISRYGLAGPRRDKTD